MQQKSEKHLLEAKNGCNFATANGKHGHRAAKLASGEDIENDDTGQTTGATSSGHTDKTRRHGNKSPSIESTGVDDDKSPESKTKQFKE